MLSSEKLFSTARFLSTLKHSEAFSFNGGIHIKPTISKEVLILQNEINSVNLFKETPDFCTSLPKLT